MTILYIVATPIGNLDDITRRALQVLAEVDVVAAEDTRHTRSLLSHFGLDKRLVNYRDQNEVESTQGLLALLQQGQSVALVSDAGTPLISDPGYRLVQAAHAAGITVVPIPGPSAVLTALSVAGLPTDSFSFEGFLPAKQAARLSQLEQGLGDPHTRVYFEAPHRLEAALADIASVHGEQHLITLARELTKRFEQIWHGPVASAQAAIRQGTIPVRGEFVLVVAGDRGEAGDEVSAEARRVLGLLLPEMPPRKAAELASAITGERKKRLYELAVQLRQDS